MSDGFFGGFQTTGAFEVEAFQTSLFIVEIGPCDITFLPASTNSQVPELSDYYASIEYLDINGEPYTPVSVEWRLWDATNQVLLSDWITIQDPGIMSQIDIAASDHMISNPNHLVEAREVIVHVVASGGAQRYDSAIYNVLAVPDIP